MNDWSLLYNITTVDTLDIFITNQEIFLFRISATIYVFKCILGVLLLPSTCVLCTLTECLYKILISRSLLFIYSNERHRLLTPRIDAPKSITLSSKGYQIGNQPSTHEINQYCHWRYHEETLVDPEDRFRRNNLRINRIKDRNNETWEECEERVNCLLEEKLDIGISGILILWAHQ